MNKFALNLIAIAAAQENETSWASTDVKYYSENMPSCLNDADCTSGYYCLNHMWTFTEQIDSGRGCWREEVCSGNGSYDIFDGRIIQWFCSDE